ncbi:hypothetical protein BN140_0405 [Methanoculleus bourgensis MS2]|jgi:hypothetical protein|uniref:Uncharacterized protein n=1 Tax=Methanoculleus bourgensis (strain ATCC 43281 / DSM 3045 / OCM 15 / MS2) TaxID=1201294 RepID=I7J7E1_METBM|nr:hypothetical protein [Methanoculleus bourgensis]CCJ35328.1 hypothetical protein BN140_0405 [Methanoculleus bourgensis MS2]
MSLKVRFTIAQVLDITDEEDHLHELVTATARARGGVYDREVEPLIFGILEDLEDYLVEQSRAGKFRGPDMKKIVSAWIDERLAEVGGG